LSYNVEKGIGGGGKNDHRDSGFASGHQVSEAWAVSVCVEGVVAKSEDWADKGIFKTLCVRVFLSVFVDCLRVNLV